MSPYDEWINEWERTTIRVARRNRIMLRAVLVLLVVAWLVNVKAVIGAGSWWNWAAVAYLPAVAALNLRSSGRLHRTLDLSLLLIEQDRVAREQRDEP